MLAASSLGQLSEVWGDLATAAGAAERLGAIMATRPAIAAPANPVPLPSPPRGSVAFDKVDFSYAATSERSALHRLSFTVAPGERIAIVGPSGAGKTTIFQLILRFYDPQGGRVLVDGVDLTRADPIKRAAASRSWRRTRRSSARPVADNIRYGVPDASDEAVPPRRRTRRRRRVHPRLAARL